MPLPDGRDVWIFGDTLYGPKRSVVGQTPRMVHNSLGISTCKGGKWHLQYVVKHGASGDAQSYFSPLDSTHWYWAMDGFYSNGDLWVTLLCIRHSSKHAAAGFDFETCGSDLAQVSHLERNPQQWEVTIHKLVPDGVGAYPSAAAVVNDGYAYLFALYEKGTRPLLATRVPLKKLSEPAANLQYLAMDGTWKRGFDPLKAKVIMQHGSSELSIRYHPALKKWLAVMVDPALFSGKIIVRTAPAITGPWTEGEVVYEIPEMQPGPTRDKNVFCYAGKEHPELETGSDLLFTYVCNTMDTSELTTHRDIYYPQVVRRGVPASATR
ncbi:MAG TPA: DUF4185 domain-containing protein [Bryocella sp.]|nr:DUF4185 domain-containing protein [Bryocella sp.]